MNSRLPKQARNLRVFENLTTGGGHSFNSHSDHFIRTDSLHQIEIGHCYLRTDRTGFGQSLAVEYLRPEPLGMIEYGGDPSRRTDLIGDQQGFRVTGKPPIDCSHVQRCVPSVGSVGHEIGVRRRNRPCVVGLFGPVRPVVGSHQTTVARFQQIEFEQPITDPVAPVQGLQRIGVARIVHGPSGVRNEPERVAQIGVDPGIGDWLRFVAFRFRP